MISSAFPEAEFLDEIQTEKSYEFSSLLFTVTSTALPREFYFFKLTQRLMLSYSILQRRKDENLIENHTPSPYGLRNPYKNLKSENSQDYAQKPQRNCTFMNLASV
jgi:hypothetical protein